MIRLRSLSFLLVLVATVGCGKKATPEPIWIGHLAPLSGTERERGEPAIQAIRAVLEQAHEDEFDVGGRPVGVRHVDSTSGKARAEAVRLLAVNRVGALIVGPGVTEVSEILAAARAHSAPVIVLTEMAQYPDHPNALYLGLDPSARGEVLARYAREQAKATSAVVIVESDCDVCAAVAGAFAKEWGKGRGTLRTLTLAEFERDESLRTRLADEPPDVFLAAVRYAHLHGPKSSMLAGTAKRPILFGGEGHEPADPDVWAGRKLPTLVWATPTPDREQPLLGELEKRAAGRLSTDSLLALDAIRLLMHGLKEADSPERGKLLGALRGIEEFEGAAGKVEWKEGRPVRRLSILAGGKVAGSYP